MRSKLRPLRNSRRFFCQSVGKLALRGFTNERAETSFAGFQSFAQDSRPLVHDQWAGLPWGDLLQTVLDDECEVAVLHQTLSETELIEIADFIRRRRPAARILIIRQEEWWLSDAHYDDRVVPDSNPKLLLSAVWRLAS
jgi:hypothetical protein